MWYYPDRQALADYSASKLNLLYFVCNNKRSVNNAVCNVPLFELTLRFRSYIVDI